VKTCKLLLEEYPEGEAGGNQGQVLSLGDRLLVRFTFQQVNFASFRIDNNFVEVHYAEIIY